MLAGHEVRSLRAQHADPRPRDLSELPAAGAHELRGRAREVPSGELPGALAHPLLGEPEALESWREKARCGARWDLNGLILKDFYCGKPFSEVLDVIYRESKGDLLSGLHVVRSVDREGDVDRRAGQGQAAEIFTF